MLTLEPKQRLKELNLGDYVFELDKKQEELLKVANILGVYTASKDDLHFLEQKEIVSRLCSFVPDLLIQKAVAFKEFGFYSDVLAKIEYPRDCCDGHYPGHSFIPLVDAGRATTQTAALLAHLKDGGHRKIPLLRGFSKIKLMSTEICELQRFGYWVWATVACGNYVTRYYSGLTYQLIALVEDCKYEFINRHDMPLRICAEAKSQIEERENFVFERDISTDEIYSWTPQRPPFYIIKKAQLGKMKNGNPAIKTVSRCPQELTRGHLSKRKNILGAGHFSRAFAQSGMLLATAATDQKTQIAEVLNTKTLRVYPEHFFYENNDITVIAECIKVFKSGKGFSLALVRGVVYVGEKAVLETDEFCFIMVPRKKHIVGLKGIDRILACQPIRHFLAFFTRTVREVLPLFRNPYC